MTRPRLVVPGEGGEALSFAEAARAAMDRVLARGAIALTIIYETGSLYAAEAVPPSSALTVGLISEYENSTDVSEGDEP